MVPPHYQCKSPPSQVQQELAQQCPRNIVASRRNVFSPTARKTEAGHSLQVENEYKENSKSNLIGSYAIAPITENTKSTKPSERVAVSSVAIPKKCKPNSSTKSMLPTPVVKIRTPEDSSSLVATRKDWLQQRVAPQTIFNKEEKAVETDQHPGLVAARTMMLRKQLEQENVENFRATKPAEPVKRKSKPRLKAQEKPKTLVQARAKWLNKQVSKNEHFEATSSDEEEDGGRVGEEESQKSEIQCRLERYQSSVKPDDDSLSGVAPRRSLSELP